MTQRRTHKLIWWLLPLLALRGMVPAGFMIDMSSGAPSMVICHGGYATTTSTTTHSDAASQASVAGHDDNAGHDNSSQHANTICPFAAASIAATFVGVLSTPADFFVVASTADDGIVGTYLPFGPSRAQQSRAPPSLA